MEANMAQNDTPMVFIKGIDKIIKRDLEKHKGMLDQCKLGLTSFREAVSHQVKKKKHYKSLIGGEKYDDDALRKSMEMIAIDIRHMSDKVKLTQEEIEHHSLIVETLSTQLEEYYDNKIKRDEFKNAISH